MQLSKADYSVYLKTCYALLKAELDKIRIWMILRDVIIMPAGVIELKNLEYSFSRKLMGRSARLKGLFSS